MALLILCSILFGVFLVNANNSGVDTDRIHDTKRERTSQTNSDIETRLLKLENERINDANRLVTMHSLIDKLIFENDILKDKVEHLSLHVPVKTEFPSHIIEDSRQLKTTDPLHGHPDIQAEERTGHNLTRFKKVSSIGVLTTRREDNFSLTKTADHGQNYMVVNDQDGVTMKVHSLTGKSRIRKHSNHPLGRLTTRRKVYDTYAFYAHMHRRHRLGNDQALIFYRVYTNIGNGYNRNTGKFTCKENGVYVFSLAITIQTGDKNKLNANLLKNNRTIASYNVDQVSYQTTGGANVVLELNVNDEIWVRIKGASIGTVLQPVYSMFSGFKLI